MQKKKKKKKKAWETYFGVVPSVDIKRVFSMEERRKKKNVIAYPGKLRKGGRECNTKGVKRSSEI